VGYDVPLGVLPSIPAERFNHRFKQRFMSHLHLRLLGEPEVRHDDVVLHFPTRKTLALLVYLVVEGGQHTRKDLTARFWPEQSMHAWPRGPTFDAFPST
jgi:hypothetical protein